MELTVENKQIQKRFIQSERELSFKMVAVAELEYDNGTKGETMTLFNNETDFENLVIGLEHAYKRQDDITSVKITICKIISGILEPFIFYDRIYFSYEEKVIATNGSHLFYVKSRNRNNPIYPN